MSPRDTLRAALRALTRNPLRSGLTTLGIAIGVGAVIAMVAIGDGARAQVEKSFAAMGANLLVVLPGSTRSGGAMGGFGSAQTVTWDDLKALRGELPAVRWAAPELRTSAQVLSDELNWTTTVTGTTPDYFQIRTWAVARGAVMRQSDVDGAVKQAWIGQTLAVKLFGGLDPVGRVVRVKGAPFTVAGLLARKGQAHMGMDQDDVLFVPVTTFQQKVQGGLRKYVPGPVLLGAATAEAVPRAERQVRALLRDRHRLEPATEDDFAIRRMSEIASARQEGTETLTTLLAAIAGVSLLVGGIGIMNIMLVSVTERTREIGVRLAVGARGRDIRLQFLVEAVALSLLGGLLGAGLGAGAAAGLAARFGWEVLFRPVVVLLALGVSGLTGVAFGLYPAHRAAGLDPIQALRFE